jgi:hypothetical protein
LSSNLALAVADGQQKVDVQDNFSEPSGTAITIAMLLTGEEPTELEKRAELLKRNADWRPSLIATRFPLRPTS